MEKIVLEQATMLVSLSCGAFNPSTWAKVFLHELIALKVKARDFDFLKDLDFRAIKKNAGHSFSLYKYRNQLYIWMDYSIFSFKLVRSGSVNNKLKIGIISSWVNHHIAGTNRGLTNNARKKKLFNRWNGIFKVYDPIPHSSHCKKSYRTFFFINLDQDPHLINTDSQNFPLQVKFATMISIWQVQFPELPIEYMVDHGIMNLCWVSGLHCLFSSSLCLAFSILASLAADLLPRLPPPQCSLISSAHFAFDKCYL